MTAADQPTSTVLPTVYLHIGTLKSGTSFIQGTLTRHRDLLAVNGVLFPGVRWSDQVDAARDVLNEQRHENRRRTVQRTWDDLAGEMLSWHGSTVVYSMELLSLAFPENIARVVSSLRPADVHVIVTARDLVRVIPSAWQESVQNRQTWTWDEYVSGLTSSGDDEALPAHRFWRQQDVPRLVREWGAQVGLERVHLVVVPPNGAPRDELWRRFAGVIGVDPDEYPIADSQRGNPSVGAPSAEFLRRLNTRLGKRFDIDLYERYVKQLLAKRSLSGRPDEERLSLPPDYDTWVRNRATQMITELGDLGMNVSGELSDLQPAPPVVGRSPITISESAVADAGVHAVEVLVRELAATMGGERRPGRRGRRSGAVTRGAAARSTRDRGRAGRQRRGQ